MVSLGTPAVDRSGAPENMSLNKMKKIEWRVISTRISPEQRELLKKKHPNEGEVSHVLRQLIDKYLAGKIFGIVSINTKL